MKRVVFIFLFFISFSAPAQKNQFAQIDDIYTNWETSYLGSEILCDTFYYSDIIDSYSIERVEAIFSEHSTFLNNPDQDSSQNNKITFSKKEIIFIVENLQSLKYERWPDKMFPNSKVVAFNSIDSIQKSVNDRKLDPLDRLCYSVHQFSKPIFLRDESISILFRGKTNFATKEGEFWIYKKERQGWTKFSPLYRWIE